MRRIGPASAALLPILAFCDMATCQVNFTSPAGFLTVEGPAWRSWFGSSSYGRYSLQDGTLRNSRLTLKEIAMRHDYRSYGNVGRRWFSVELRMSECNIAARVKTWTRMAVTTPTQVFKASMSWPATLTKPTSKPLPFRIRFPFSRNWTYSGKNDINADFEFVGGVLDNNLAWKTSFGSTWYHSLYHLDSATNAYGATIAPQTSIGRGCLGSPASWFGAAATIDAHTYSSQYVDPQRRGHTLVQVGSRNTSLGQPIVFALGVAATAGQTFPGIRCEKDYIDATKPVLYFFGAASNWYLRPVFFGRYQSWFAGVPLVGQAIFNSWSPGTLGLTSAVRVQVPSMPALQPERYLWRSDDWLSKTGSGPYLGGVPIVRFTR